ncbi:MAG: TRIC cation channel family protein [Erysipelotrichaceae bacterium]|nr:TRIC cation channel family protein [Erysipelotrichaceae bacterium]
MIIDIEILLIIMSFIGTVAFSVSGALIAIENKLDLFGVIILGVITACGGGIIRDIMLSKEIRIFTEPWYLLTSVGVGIIIRFLAFRFKWSLSKVKLNENDT